MEARHALKSGVPSEAVQAQQEPRPQNRAIEGLVGGRALKSVGEIQAEVGLLEHVEETGHRPGRDGFGLDCGQVRGFGLGIERRHRDPGILSSLPVDANAAIARHAGVKDVERLTHFGLEIGDEAVRVEGQLQRLIIRCALSLEIGRKILIRVAVSVGADHPDFLAPKLIAQGLQDADFVGDPVDAL